MLEFLNSVENGGEGVIKIISDKGYIILRCMEDDIFSFEVGGNLKNENGKSMFFIKINEAIINVIRIILEKNITKLDN